MDSLILFHTLCVSVITSVRATYRQALHLLSRGHDLDLDTLASQVIKYQVLSRLSDVVDTPSNADNFLQLFPGFNDALWTVFFNIFRQRYRYVKLMGIRVGLSRLA